MYADTSHESILKNEAKVDMVEGNGTGHSTLPLDNGALRTERHEAPCSHSSYPVTFKLKYCCIPLHSEY